MVVKMKGLILSGGHGTRLWPITHTQAKQLIPIANKPILFYAIEDLKEAGITNIGIIVGYTPERIKRIKDAVGDGSRWGVKITYIEQDAPRGIAHAIWTAKDYIGNEPFVVYLGDNILKGGIKDYVDEFKNSGCDFGILLAKHKTPEKFGVAIMKNGKLVGLIEKPKNPPSDFVISGIYFLKPSTFDVIEDLLKGPPGARGEYQITDVADRMVKSKQYKVTTHIVKDWWKDTGKAEDVLEANHLILDDLKPYNKGVIEKGATIRGKVCIDTGSIIKKGSFIRGPVIIGKNCIIGPNTYIGSYTSVGDNCEIKGGEIESSIILENCKIDFNKRIIDSLIGADSCIISGENKLPSGYKLIIGENSQLCI
jgi:glucose-1-phosphate thymidylyltransferase